MVRALVGLSTMTRVCAKGGQVTVTLFIAPSRRLQRIDRKPQARTKAQLQSPEPLCPARAMPELGALFLSTQALAAPGDLLNLALNAGAIAPEGAVLLAMLATLLVDLAGEKVSVRWVPPICYAGLGTALVLLALQWNAPLESSFLGAFLPDHLALSLIHI